MKLAIIGGTGLIGKACVQMLLERAEVEQVYSLSRRPLGLQHEKLCERIDPQFDLPKLCTDLRVDAAISCFGTTMKQAKSKENFEFSDLQLPWLFARHMKEQGASRFFLVSSIGASKLSGNFYLRTKGSLEQELLKLEFKSLHIFRPSLLLGERAQRRPAEALAGAVLGTLGPLFPTWLWNYRPVAAERVAELMVQRICEQDAGGIQIWDNCTFHQGYQATQPSRTSPFY